MRAQAKDPQERTVALVLLTYVADEKGFNSVMDLLEAVTFETVECPGICTGCKTVVDSVETDARDYHCEDCHSNGLGWELCRTVKSVLVIAELV